MKWTEVNNYAPKNTNGDSKSEFYRVKDGDNRIRIVSEPEARGVHWVNNKPTTCTGKDTCKPCQSEEPSVKFLFYVIDREDGMLKIAEFGYSVVRQLADFQTNPDYAFDAVPPYDVTIKKEGQKQKTKYTVIPARKNSDLTPTEFALLTAVRPLSEVVTALKKKAASVPAVSSDEIPLEVIEV